MNSFKYLSWQSAKENVISFLKKSNYEDLEALLKELPWLCAEDANLEMNRGLIDQAFREHLLRMISKWDVNMLKKYVQMNIDLCRRDLSTPSSPVLLLSDIFDMSTLEFCENLFNFVETNVYVWKEDLFFAVCKNNLLRMCNDLLRRLSRSQNTVFCGRILLFLAQFFPFSERSGLNIVSEFNLENVTDFNSNGDLESLIDEEINVKETDTKIKVDFSLYSKFWYLQNFFRCPNDLYVSQKWMGFKNYASYTLSALQNYKLDSGSEKAYLATLTAGTDKDNRYFAKFLTSQKLLELQLSDSNFRRYVLVQFLILFQYLTSTVKSKPESFTLKPEQIEWINEHRSIVFQLIEETPPDGPQFLNTVEKILQREERWNEWKNKSCPEIKKPNPTPVDFKDSGRKEKRLGDTLKDYSNRKRFFMGSKSLTLLWNNKPDNMAACRSADRNFTPSLENYFKDAIEQADPSAMIEPQYKRVNEIDYAWRGLRLMSQKCPYFFSQCNNPINKSSDFLENMLSRIHKDKPTVANVEEKVKTEPAEVENQDVIINNTDGVEEGEVGSDEPQNGDEPMDNIETSKRTPVTKEQLDRIAEAIRDDWQKLGLKMGYRKDEIEFFENERPVPIENGDGPTTPTNTSNARYLLQIWSEDDDDPSVETLSAMLESLGMLEALQLLKST